MLDVDAAGMAAGSTQDAGEAAAAQALLVRSAIGEGRIGRGCVGRVRAATIATHRLTKAVEKPRELGAATARGDLSVLLLVGRGARQLLSEPHVFGRHADEDDGENDGDERGPGPAPRRPPLGRQRRARRAM